MRIPEIFNVFSRRHAGGGANDKPIELPPTFRNKILMYCEELFRNDRNTSRPGDYRTEFWSDVHRSLSYRKGQATLVPALKPETQRDDAANFLVDCPTEEFLDFLEDVFRVECFWQVADDGNEVVENFNALIESEDAPLRLTNFSYETVEEAWLGSTPRKVTRTTDTPRVILQESDAIHAHSIQPALTLLSAPEFKAANAEFLDALTDYRKQDYGDCLTKCCSALESTMKVLCAKHGWPYKENDTAGPLLKTMIAQTGLPSYMEQPLILIATIRNRLSASHGGGQQQRQPPQHIARYTIGATASAILLVVDASEATP